MRRSPDNAAGVLSPPATMAVLLTLLVVVALSVQSVAARTTAIANSPAPHVQPVMSASSGA